MIVKVTSSTIVGISSHPVEVEVDVSLGFPQFTTVGLPDAAVKESKDRIRAAIKNSRYPFPRNHVTVNLAPADIKKEGTGFDLPIALGILSASELIDEAVIREYLILGELSLDGTVKGVSGVLPAVFQARQRGMKGVIIPRDNFSEAALVEGLEIVPVASLAEAVEHVNGTKKVEPLDHEWSTSTAEASGCLDFSDIKGQDHAKRALEIAAAGGHNLIMIGPPGSGKTMLAQRLGSILPPMTLEEAIEVTKIYSVAGLLDRKRPLIKERPFRAPHHSISDAGLVGGGHQPKPGEISLAHQGVLFLDELPEFRRNVLEALRQPLESGQITITRTGGMATYPAKFMLVAAMNPCPCGFHGDRRQPCRCSLPQIRQYQGRISGPLLDRIDIHLEVPTVRYVDISGVYEGASSGVMRARVLKAREIQKERFAGQTVPLNARLTDRQVKQLCHLDLESQKLIEMAMDKLGMSARAYTRILKLARTIADLAGLEDIQPSHVAEAIQLRNLDRRLI